MTDALPSLSLSPALMDAARNGCLCTVVNHGVPTVGPGPAILINTLDGTDTLTILVTAVMHRSLAHVDLQDIHDSGARDHRVTPRTIRAKHPDFAMEDPCTVLRWTLA